MSRWQPAPLLPAWMREELAPREGRWRHAMVIAGSSTIALGLALVLQFGSFPPALLAFKALQPGIVCTWRTLWIRLVAIAFAAVFATFFTGLLVQTPWLLAPAFFAAVLALVYAAPISQHPIASYALALTVAATVYKGIYDPRAIGDTAGSLGVGFAIGIVIATLASELRAIPDPRQQLGNALAARFAKIGEYLREAAWRFQAGTGGASESPPVSLTRLAQHLQLLGLVRQETPDPAVAQSFVALITVAERAALFAATADAASRERPGAGAGPLEGDLRALLDALDRALARFEAAAHHPEMLTAGLTVADLEPWPDLSALVGVLHTRLTELEGSTSSVVALSEATGARVFVQALDGLADVLHSPPEALEHVPPDPQPATAARLLPPFDPFAFLFAAKVALATVLSLLAGVIANTPALETIVLTPLIVAQSSFGASIRKVGLRLAGVTTGGIAAILVAASLMVNTNEVAVWLLVFFLIVLPFAYVSLGTPRTSYFGLQAGATFMIIIIAQHPIVDVHAVLWRFLGTALGGLILFGVFAVLLPDYAGRQIVATFGSLLDALLVTIPESGKPPPPLVRTTPLTERFSASLASLLRLADEAGYEGSASGVDPSAAIDAAGILRRVGHRFALVRHARRSVERPTLPTPAETALRDLESAVRTRLVQLQRVVRARHHRARPGSSEHRAACEAAQAIAARERPDLRAPLAALFAAVEAARDSEMRAWPSAASDALLAEMGHWRRIAELVPRLETRLVAAVLPLISDPRLSPILPWAPPAISRS